MKRVNTAVSLLAVIIASTAFTAVVHATELDSEAPYTPYLRCDLQAYRFVADVDDAASLFVNPAGLGARRNFSSLLMGTYQYDRLTDLVMSLSMPSLGIGYSCQDTELFSSDTYILGLGGRFGKWIYTGSSFRWHHTSHPTNGSPFSMDEGLLIRPHRYISVGGVWKNINRPRFGDGRLEDTFTGGISLRPLTERITLSGQGTFADGSKPGWLAGGRLSIVPGLELFGSYMRDYSTGGADPYEDFTGGIAFTLGSTRLRSSTRSRSGGDPDYGRYSFAIENTISYVENSLIHLDKYAEVAIDGRYLDEGGGFTLRGRSKDLHRTLSELEKAREDSDIKGLLIKIGSIGGGFIGPVDANLYEIREAVKGVKQSGKPVVAYLNGVGTAAELYLASAADRIIIPREGTVGLIGVSLELNRMKRLFAKLGIDWEYATAGDYKSTFHTPVTDTTTAVQAEEIRSLVDESYRLLVEGIAEGRGMDIDRMIELADGRLFSPEEAVEEGLVDLIGWERTAREELGRLVGITEKGRIEAVSLAKRTYWTERWKQPPLVAIVGAYGTIGSGKSKEDFLSGARNMGSETVVKQLKAAASDPRVKAIVFRVDSGGGSALASDEILNEIRRIQREENIPVIVSMGNIAGSGGYWIAMYGDAIFADPFTITGSIGVAFFKPVLARLYDKIGITNEVFKAGEHADVMSLGRMMTDEEREHFSSFINECYDHFVEYVSEGRSMDPEEVLSVAGGRVYFGTQALDINLIDRIGGLNDAVEYAAARAGIDDDYGTVYFKAFPGFFLRSVEVPETGLSLGRILRALRRDREECFDETLSVF